MNPPNGRTKTVQTSKLITDSYTDSNAKECIERIYSSASSGEVGYKVQALAAHVLLRLGYQIKEVNHSGHPDIVAIRDGREFRFEVEAEVTGPRLRKLTEADLASLMEGPNVVGYYALAISSPEPYWVLVLASELAIRNSPSSNVLLEALSDREYSAEWTREYVRLLQNACQKIRLTPFSKLSCMALEGNPL